MNLQTMLIRGAEELGITLSKEHIDNFSIYLNELKIWSKKINLTGLKKDEDIITNHFLDSLSILKYIKNGSTLLDIGTGAGFPGVPIAIVCPSCFITVLDSAGKKILFVRNIIRSLELQNVRAVAGRAEDKENDLKRKSYDFVVTRAVSDIKSVIELSSPYLNENGRVIVMRGEKGGAELEAMSVDLENLEFSVDKIDVFCLPFSGQKRVNIIFKRNS
jgi:16S rRNA (guanine527-N7)-methyltransferase